MILKTILVSAHHSKLTEAFHFMFVYIYGGVNLFNLAIDPDLGDLFVEDLFQVKNHLVF